MDMNIGRKPTRLQTRLIDDIIRSNRHLPGHSKLIIHHVTDTEHFCRVEYEYWIDDKFVRFCRTLL